MTPQEFAIGLIVASINTWLEVAGQSYRVEPCDVVMTRRGGVTFLAFPETLAAADWRDGAPKRAAEKSAAG